MTAQNQRADRIVDLRNSEYPWGVLTARSLFEHMRRGEVLEVLSADPLVLKYFRSILKHSRSRLIQLDEEPKFFRIYLRRG